jgi:hypothetical protein
MPEICENFTGWLVGSKPHETIVTRLRCKQWTCSYCAEQNARQWRAIIIDAVNKIGGQWYMLTLTAHRNATKRATSLKNIQSGWKLLIDRMRRINGGKFDYVRVYETHKNGRVHLHAMVNWIAPDYKPPKIKSDPGSRWIKDNAVQCGLGHQVKYELIKGHAGLCAAYVTKYLTKHLAVLPEGTRRVQTSQGFKQPTDMKPSEYTWTKQERITDRELVFLWTEGITVIDMQLNSVITLDDCPNGYYEPT